MNLKDKNLIIIAGGLLVVLLVFSIFFINRGGRKTQTELIYDTVTQQSQSTQIEDIEDDLMQTDIDNVDRELQQIENDLESAY